MDNELINQTVNLVSQVTQDSLSFIYRLLQNQFDFISPIVAERVGAIVQFTQYQLRTINVEQIIFLIPLGILGIWRWSVWLFKEIVALFYRPVKNDFRTSVSIVTPVYNEDPQVFLGAINSWQANNPDEIIAVIDEADKQNIQNFQNFAQVYTNAKLIVTAEPGKRAALAAGIKTVRSKLIALVDSDTIWEKDVIKNALPPFIDPQIAGVATRQNVLETRTLAQKIFDIQLDQRYFDEMPFLAAAGDALICLSGRTAFYRADILLPLVPELLNETFFGKKVVSGDDKRLTYLVLAKGWKVAYQNNARVLTPGFENMKGYLKQRLRWTRNSLRADMRALAEGWVFRHKALFFFQIDRVIQTFTILVSPIFFSIALLEGNYFVAGLIAGWWLISRTIKIFPHLRRKPTHITILPIFILFTFVSAIIKVYALFTLNTQGWITRWDVSRLPKFRLVRAIPSYLATVAVFGLLFVGVFTYRNQLIRAFTIDNISYEQKLSRAYLVESTTLKKTAKPSLLGSQTQFTSGEIPINRYVIQPGDSIFTIANEFNTSPETILSANRRFLPSWESIDPGMVLSIPTKEGLNFQNPDLNFRQKSEPELRITYLSDTNTIEVFGRGNSITLRDIANQAPTDKLREVKKGEWLLSANLYIRSGIILHINNDEVNWLKIESNQNDFLNITIDQSVVVFQDVKVTSWDSSLNKVDENYSDGRSHILARDGGRMDIYRSEMAYLGYYPKVLKNSPYGVSWRISNGTFGQRIVTGEVRDSKFHHNYFGAYTFGATGMIWTGNEFYENIQYGWDGHDDTNTTLIENNRAYKNGNHGIICSKRCFDLVIRNNIVYNNKLHGIMLHEKTDRNTIENNTVYGNKDGIAIYQSSNNIVRGNKIYNNRIGVRLNLDSINNLIENNEIIDHSKYGVYLYNKADNNFVINNLISQNPIAIYSDTVNNEIASNNILQNELGIYFLPSAQNNKLIENNFIKNKDFAIYSKTNLTNMLSNNNFDKDNPNIGY